jgi:hypothetical protein
MAKGSGGLRSLSGNDRVAAAKFIADARALSAKDRREGLPRIIARMERMIGGSEMPVFRGQNVSHRAMQVTVDALKRLV